MGHGKETPRQKMIGMMYLVLTALLALNVSKDVLDAFILIDDGLVKTTMNFVSKNQTSYEIFEAQLDKSPRGVQPYFDAAMEVKKRADQLTLDLQELKIEIIRLVDGNDAPALKRVVDGKPTREDNVLEWIIGYGADAERKQTLQITGLNIQGKDNMDKPAQIMIFEGKGAALQAKIDEFREFLLEVVTSDENIQRAIEEVLSTIPPPQPSGEPHPWDIANFSHLPTAAVVTNLSKMQSDVRYAEAEAVQYLLQQIGATDTRVNKMEAVVLTKSNYVLVGSQFEARVLLAAYDSLQRPEIWLGPYRRTEDDYELLDGATLVPYDNRGRAMIVRSGSSVGNFTIGGLLRMPTPEGVRSFPFSSEYTVGQSSTVISPTAMNALYVGVENPISVQVSGVPTEQIQVTIDNGTIRRSGSGWIAEPRTAGNATITASGVVDGVTQRGSMPFRVRMLPTPIAKIAGRTGGNIERNVLEAQQGIQADLGADFLFDVRYTVTQFTMETMTGGVSRAEASTSQMFTPAQMALIRTLTRGSKVFFTNIKARGPDGVRDLVEIGFTIQ